MNEPNVLPVFFDMNYHGVITRHPNMGFLRGYLRLPPSNRFHGKGYDEIDVDVHGGLTFFHHSLNIDMNRWDENTGGWWIGFDCGHFMDTIPNYKKFDRDSTYKNIWYVVRELERLYKQVKDQSWLIHK